MARNHLTACLLAFAALGAACGGGDDATATAAQETQVAQARVRADSMRKVRAQAADSAGTDSTATVTSAALTPPGASGGPMEAQVQRETFAYAGGARDPFASLMNMEAVGPELGNLQLVGIYLDLRTGDNSVAVLREKDSGKRHKLHAGDHLGRMQVVQIGAKDVVFRIEDFGYERQETLSLRKQEDITP